eukprot:16428184-Heterocapsa_arctica.AAC.1
MSALLVTGEFSGGEFEIDGLAPIMIRNAVVLIDGQRRHRSHLFTGERARSTSSTSTRTSSSPTTAAPPEALVLRAGRPPLPCGQGGAWSRHRGGIQPPRRLLWWPGHRQPGLGQQGHARHVVRVRPRRWRRIGFCPGPPGRQ